MTYYLCELADGTRSIWEVQRRTARRLSGFINIERFEAVGRSSIFDTIRAQTPWFEPAGHNPFHRIERGPGEFYPFIARPYDLGPYSEAWCPSELTEPDTLARSHGQLLALTRELGDICQVVQPTRANMGAFGHEIRSLLILACTEVETHWTRVMRANGVTKRNLDRRDYVRLVGPMGLREFSVRFPRFPWLAPVRPFAGWGRGGRLHWYDAYNRTKHDAERHFSDATLEHAMTAVTSCVVMAEAQFGTGKALPAGSDLPAFFQFEARPTWPASKIYLSRFGATWRAVNEGRVRAQ